MAVKLFPSLHMSEPPIHHIPYSSRSNNRQSPDLRDMRKARDMSMVRTPQTEQAPVDQDSAASGMTLNIGDKQHLDPQLYAKNLADVNPQLAAQYSKHLNDLEESDAKMKKAQIDLEDAKNETRAKHYLSGMHWANATGDLEGARRIMNKGSLMSGEDPKSLIQDLQKDEKGNLKYLENGKWNTLNEEDLVKLNAGANQQLAAINENKRWSDRLAYLKGKGLDGRLEEWDSMHTDGTLNDDDWKRGREAILGGARRIGPETDKNGKAITPTKTDYAAAQNLVDNDSSLKDLSPEERKNAATLAASTFRSLLNKDSKMDEKDAWTQAVGKEASQVKEEQSSILGVKMPWTHKTYTSALPPDKRQSNTEQDTTENKVSPGTPPDKQTDTRVRVKDKDGNIGTIPQSQLEDAKSQGYLPVE